MAMALFVPSPSSSSSSTHGWKRFQSPSRSRSIVQVRASSSSPPPDSPGSTPLRRPGAPSTVKPAPSPSPSPLPETPAPSPAPSPAPAPANPIAAATGFESGVTVEFQRQRAKELQEYFLDRKFQRQAEEGRIFGWSRKNEVGNGRWAMFGIAVGLLTEFATGSSIVDQLRIVVANLGIADFD
ncbi:LHC-related protein [Selaginella moellendorffii]|uniref:LHC-related protein n=1 Tax=Selaginella moellendorffii TaxID=88036 RepID=D8RWU5_SELML|nr:LHC-related protein [Selaginella moellendorffii]